MPPLSPLALRYVLWFFGLSVLYSVLVSLASLPASLATGVILASIPAADVGMQATKRATRALALGDWGVIWGLCMGIYLLLSVAGPAIIALISPEVREGIDAARIARETVLSVFGTAVMMAIFLWIGNRSAGGPKAE